MQTGEKDKASLKQTGAQITPLEKLFKEIIEVKWSKGFLVTLKNECRPPKILINHENLSISLSFPEMNGDGAYTMLPTLEQVKGRLQAFLLGEGLRIEQEQADIMKRKQANKEALVAFLVE